MSKFDELLTLDEVASIFKVSKGTIRNWTNAGRLACVRTPGGQRRFRKTDIERALEVSGNEKGMDR